MLLLLLSGASDDDAADADADATTTRAEEDDVDAAGPRACARLARGAGARGWVPPRMISEVVSANALFCVSV
jgi:hypothetical protein